VVAGRYRLEARAGEGGMGVVYRARHVLIDRVVALKLIRPDLRGETHLRAWMLREARAANRVDHAHIIDIHDIGETEEGELYLVMEYLVGTSLSSELAKGPMALGRAVDILEQMCAALARAHDLGVVHRDLKSDNILLSTRGGRKDFVKILDFGLAHLAMDPRLAPKGAVFGTPEYMSPEQARGHGVDYRTDVYALGIVMFEILAGSRPFPPLGEPVAVLMQHAEEPPLSLADTVAGLPDEMVQLVDAMLAKTPQARPSLAAVRTVIKRLRTTQLPTRSVAGMPMSSYSQLAARPDLAITASRVGAEAVLPEPRTASIRRPITTPPPPSTHGAAHARSAPATTPPRPGSALVLDARLPSALQQLAAASRLPTTAKPDVTTRGVGVQSVWGSQPGVPRFNPTPHPDVPRGPPIGSQPLPPVSAASPVASPPASPGPRVERSGATLLGSPGASASRMPPTTLGVGAPGAGRPARQPPIAPSAPRSKRWWLAIALLLLVASAVALAFVLRGGW
jgi:serine/threonine protein kinase